MTEITCKECDSPNIDMGGITWECEDCGYTEMMV